MFILVELRASSIKSDASHSSEQPPYPALVMHFPVTFLLGMHEQALVFTLQEVCGQMCPSPPSVSGFSNRITMHQALSTGDCITRDSC